MESNIKDKMITDSRGNAVTSDYSSSSTIYSTKKYKALIILDIPVLQDPDKASLDVLASMENGIFINSTSNKDYIIEYLKDAVKKIDTGMNGLSIEEMKMKGIIAVEILKKAYANNYDIIFGRKKDWTIDSRVGNFIKMSVSKAAKNKNFGLGFISQSTDYSVKELISSGYNGIEKMTGFITDVNVSTKGLKLSDVAIKRSDYKIFMKKEPDFAEEMCLDFETYKNFSSELMLFKALDDIEKISIPEKVQFYNVISPAIVFSKENLRDYGISLPTEGLKGTIANFNSKDMNEILIPVGNSDNFIYFCNGVAAIYAADIFKSVIYSENKNKCIKNYILSEELNISGVKVDQKLLDPSNKKQIDKESICINGKIIKKDLSSNVFYVNIMHRIDAVTRNIFDGGSTNDSNMEFALKNGMNQVSDELYDSSIINSREDFVYNLIEESVGKYILKIVIKDSDSDTVFEMSTSIEK